MRKSQAEANEPNVQMPAKASKPHHLLGVCLKQIPFWSFLLFFWKWLKDGLPQASSLCFFWSIAGLDLVQGKAQNKEELGSHSPKCRGKKGCHDVMYKGQASSLVNCKRQHPSVITLAPPLCSGVVAKQGRRRPLERLGWALGALPRWFVVEKVSKTGDLRKPKVCNGIEYPTL